MEIPVKMKRITPTSLVVASLTLSMAFALLICVGSGTASARQDSAVAQNVAQNAEKLPPDIHPETLSRMSQTTRDSLTTDEDKQAYDHLVADAPRFAKPSNGALGATGTKLVMPVVADAYWTAWNNLRDKNGVDPKYMELAVMVTCRETDLELEWVAHEEIAEKLNSRQAIDIVLNRRDAKGLDEKQQAVIQFGREMFRQLKVSSTTFANMQRLFGQRGTLAIATMMSFYAGNALLFRAYDQHLDVGKKRPFPDVLAMEAKNK